MFSTLSHHCSQRVWWVKTSFRWKKSGNWSGNYSRKNDGIQYSMNLWGSFYIHNWSLSLLPAHMVWEWSYNQSILWCLCTFFHSTFHCTFHFVFCFVFFQLSLLKLRVSQWARMMLSQEIPSHSPSKPQEHSPWTTSGNGSQLWRAVGVRSGSHVLRGGAMVLHWQSPGHTSLMKGATAVLSVTTMVAILLNQLNLVLVRITTVLTCSMKKRKKLM